jgi:hypothetical protein
MTQQVKPQSLSPRKPEGPDGIYHCLVIEPLWIRVAWLWQDPLPGEFDVNKEWGLS